MLHKRCTTSHDNNRGGIVLDALRSFVYYYERYPCINTGVRLSTPQRHNDQTCTFASSIPAVVDTVPTSPSLPPPVRLLIAAPDPQGLKTSPSFGGKGLKCGASPLPSISSQHLSTNARTPPSSGPASLQTLNVPSNCSQVLAPMTILSPLAPSSSE